MVTLVRGLARPVITLILVVAVIGLAAAGNAKAIDVVTTLTGVAVGFWFAAHTLSQRDG